VFLSFLENHGIADTFEKFEKPDKIPEFGYLYSMTMQLARLRLR
jgi:hypothetical protein